MSWRRIQSQGKIWVDDNCREELEQLVAEQAATIKAREEEIARQHSLLTGCIKTTEHAPVDKAGVS